MPENASELVLAEECFSRISKKFFSFSIPSFSSKAELCELPSLFVECLPHLLDLYHLHFGWDCHGVSSIIP